MMDDYTMVMLTKLIDALLRKDTGQDGNWGYPSFREELEDMRKSLGETDAVKKASRIMLGFGT